MTVRDLCPKCGYHSDYCTCVTYDGFPVDVAEERLEPNADYIVSTDGAGRPATKPRLFTDADLLRLAGQLELAEEQGWRFERYARCRVGEHRHRWKVSSWICQVWNK